MNFNEINLLVKCMIQLVGVFLSPMLILGYLGITGSDVNILNTFIKLTIRIVIPITVGQILRKTSNKVVIFVKKHKNKFKKAQEFALIYLVYTVFCRTFLIESGSSISNITDVLLMIIYQFILLSSLMIIAWYSLKLYFKNYPSLRVMGLFGCTFKSIAVGIPLIGSMYENNDKVGLYTLPLLIWHPMQLVISSALVPRLRTFIQDEDEKFADNVGTNMTDDDYEINNETVQNESNNVL